MDLEEIQRILSDALAGCDVRVEGEGNHLTIVAIGEVFAGKRSVQRQQQVYAVLKEYIAEGVIHAVNMKLYTSEEWQAG
jgi:acid stress-induced BolA-like protein IbaG/YrbA